MSIFTQFLDIFLHLDKHLTHIVADYGKATYAIIFAIIFCETGLVVTPFLPGDSLLFAAGATASVSSDVLDVRVLWFLIVIAAILGDASNYSIGKYLGFKVFENKNSKIFKPQYLETTNRFFEKYGAKTIVLARFVPMVRTFAPFFAGAGSMSYKKFLFYNVFGALLWATLFVSTGYYFGTLEVVKKNFSLVILGIIILSLIPGIVEYIKALKERSAPAKS